MARAKKGTVPVGNEAYRVLTEDGREIAIKGMKSLALLAAQERAQRDYTEPVKLVVERRTLFGAPVILYRVVRDEDGVIHSATINAVD
jgi:hypothetical protein